MDCDVCVVGGGPAGLMLGLLLARDGVRTVVLEKHGDFLRDFRGDTVHPSTLAVLNELGLGAQADKLPHRKVRHLTMTFADATVRFADFSRLRHAPPYLMFVPQWDFLELLATEAARYETFTLLREHEVVGLRRQDGQVGGVSARTPDGQTVTVRAALTVACDGRHSTVRRELALDPVEYGAPMDVLWFRLPRRAEDGEGLRAQVGAGQMMIGIDRGDYWQAAYLIPRGGYDRVVEAGLPALRERIATLFPVLADRVDQIADWDAIKVLTVRVNRLPRWHVPGALMIGDAAHAMSPIGGVGINLAIQDAVAAARLLSGPIRAGRLTDADLAAVQRRRQFPTVLIQGFQRFVQWGALGPLLRSAKPVRAPLPMRLVSRVPALQGIPARLVGIGPRPEHVGPPAG